MTADRHRPRRLVGGNGHLLENLRETLAILADSETVAALRQSAEEIARGDVYTTDEVLEALRARRRREASDRALDQPTSPGG